MTSNYEKYALKECSVIIKRIKSPLPRMEKTRAREKIVLINRWEQQELDNFDDVKDYKNVLKQSSITDNSKTRSSNYIKQLQQERDLLKSKVENLETQKLIMINEVVLLHKESASKSEIPKPFSSVNEFADHLRLILPMVYEEAATEKLRIEANLTLPIKSEPNTSKLSQKGTLKDNSIPLSKENRKIKSEPIIPEIKENKMKRKFVSEYSKVGGKPRVKRSKVLNETLKSNSNQKRKLNLEESKIDVNKSKSKKIRLNSQTKSENSKKRKFESTQVSKTKKQKIDLYECNLCNFKGETSGSLKVHKYDMHFEERTSTQRTNINDSTIWISEFAKSKSHNLMADNFVELPLM